MWIKILDQIKVKQVFLSPSEDGSFESLRAAAGNSPLSEWDNKPGTSTAVLLTDFQSETNWLLSLRRHQLLCHRGKFCSLYSFCGFCNYNFNHAYAIFHICFMNTPYMYLESFECNVNYLFNDKWGDCENSRVQPFNMTECTKEETENCDSTTKRLGWKKWYWKLNLSNWNQLLVFLSLFN